MTKTWIPYDGRRGLLGDPNFSVWYKLKEVGGMLLVLPILLMISISEYAWKRQRKRNGEKY